MVLVDTRKSDGLRADEARGRPPDGRRMALVTLRREAFGRRQFMNLREAADFDGG